MAAIEKNRYLRKRAAAAAFALLGVPPPAHAASLPVETPETPHLDRWSFDSSFLSYSEAERISVLEPQFGVRRDFVDNRSLDILVTVDTISGATPLGTLPATAATAPNTVTSPSGSGSNPVIGKIPLSHMSDTRYSIDTSWQQPVGADYTGIFGGNVSKETDFISLGANSKLSRDFNEKDTTLSFGLAPEFDIGNPNGGQPAAYAVQSAPGSIDGKRDTKWLASGMAGITQVINRRTLMEFNYGFTHEQGYLNDPYKLLSLVDAGGNPLSAIYEKRPRKRNEQSFYWLTKYNIWAQDVFSLGLRYYADDWGIHSQTIDFAYHRQSNDHVYWEPLVRYYHQSSANFFHVGLLSGAALPQFASADLRLASLDAVTFGLGFGYTFSNASELILRAEYYIQTGNSHPPGAIGTQRSYDLYPTLYATILQAEYHFDPSRLFSRKSSRIR